MFCQVVELSTGKSIDHVSYFLHSNALTFEFLSMLNVSNGYPIPRDSKEVIQQHDFQM